MHCTLKEIHADRRLGIGVERHLRVEVGPGENARRVTRLRGDALRQRHDLVALQVQAIAQREDLRARGQPAPQLGVEPKDTSE